MSHKTLQDQLAEIFLLIEYAAPKNCISKAKKLVERYQADRIALNIFQEFYSYLPEATDDYIKRLKVLQTKKWTFLLLVTTKEDNYIYLATLDQAIFLGKHKEGIWDKDVLKFFDMDHQKALDKFKSPDDFPEYVSLDRNKTLCTVCSVAIGENHRLGCPAELCPWCASQLSICDCKFTMLGVKKIKTEKQLKEFHKLLQKKGRVPFDLSQQPGGWSTESGE